MIAEHISRGADWMALTINLFTMSNAQDEDDQAVIFDFANEPVVTYSVCPKLSQPGALHCFSDATRIVQIRQSLMKKSQDTRGGLLVEFVQLSFRKGRNFNLPRHDAS
jgi:hypothetical protein